MLLIAAVGFCEDNSCNEPLFFVLVSLDCKEAQPAQCYVDRSPFWDDVMGFCGA